MKSNPFPQSTFSGSIFTFDQILPVSPELQKYIMQRPIAVTIGKVWLTWSVSQIETKAV